MTKTIGTEVLQAANEFVRSMNEFVVKAAQDIPQSPAAEMDRLWSEIDRLRTQMSELSTLVVNSLQQQHERSESEAQKAKPAKKSRLKRDVVSELSINVAKLISEHGEPMAIGEIIASLGLPAGPVRNAIKSAIAQGWVEMQGTRRFARYVPKGEDTATAEVG